MKVPKKIRKEIKLVKSAYRSRFRKLCNSIAANDLRNSDGQRLIPIRNIDKKISFHNYMFYRL